MKSFTLSPNKHPQWSYGDRFGPAQPCRANRKTWQGLCWSDRVSTLSGTWQGERKQSNDEHGIGSAFTLMSYRPGHGFRKPADGLGSVSGKPSRKRSSLTAVSCFGLSKSICSTGTRRGCCILSSYLQPTGQCLDPATASWELQSSSDAQPTCVQETKTACCCLLLSSLGMEKRLYRQYFVFHSPTHSL